MTRTARQVLIALVVLTIVTATVAVLFSWTGHGSGRTDTGPLVTTSK